MLRIFRATRHWATVSGAPWASVSGRNAASRIRKEGEVVDSGNAVTSFWWLAEADPAR